MTARDIQYGWDDSLRSFITGANIPIQTTQYQKSFYLILSISAQKDVYTFQINWIVIRLKLKFHLKCVVKNHTFTLKFESFRSTVTNIHMYIRLYWRHSAIWFKIIEIMSNDTKCVGKENSHLILVWEHSVLLQVEKLRSNYWTSCVKLAFVCVGNRMSNAICRCHTIAFLPGVKCVEDAHPYVIILSANATLIDLSVFVVCGFCVTINKNKSLGSIHVPTVGKLSIQKDRWNRFEET